MTVVRPVPLLNVPRVSVVVPCYNYGHYLPQLVDSLLEQPGVAVDVLIVDDASPDGSGEMADELAARHAAVSVLHHSANRGHIQTYNDGLARVTGDYVVLLSADDLLPPGALSRAVALMEHHPNVGLVYGFSQSFSGEPPLDSPVVRAPVRNWSVWAGAAWVEHSLRRGRSFIASPEVVMRTEVLRAIGDYDPRLPHSADLDLWLRAGLRVDIGRVNGPAQALYRVHDSNMHLTTYAGMVTDLRERRLTFELLFDEHAAERDDVIRLRGPAMRALAREAVRLALISHREGADRALVEEYLDFALETSPAVRSEPLWLLVAWGPQRHRRFPALTVRRLATRIRDHVDWRLRRRYGT